MSPTQRTLAKLKADGWVCTAITERWNQYARIRQDLFGFIDVLSCGEKGTLAIQACAGASVSARVQKIADSPLLPFVRKAGWTIQVWGWRKVKVKRGGRATKWECRVVEIS